MMDSGPLGELLTVAVDLVGFMIRWQRRWLYSQTPVITVRMTCCPSSPHAVLYRVRCWRVRSACCVLKVMLHTTGISLSKETREDRGKNDCLRRLRAAVDVMDPQG